MSTITKIIGRDLPNGDYIEIEAELRQDDGRGLSDGFAITVLGWEKRGTWSGRAAKRNDRHPNFAGQSHAHILQVAPELEPIVRAHLCDPDGTPMHGLANGWYFYSGKAAEYERAQIAKGRDAGYSRLLETSDHDRAARALNIDPAELPEGLTEEGFRQFVGSLADKWAGQAKAARDALDAMVDGDGVEA
jgi:hypothetical protein